MRNKPNNQNISETKCEAQLAASWNVMLAAAVAPNELLGLKATQIVRILFKKLKLDVF